MQEQILVNVALFLITSALGGIGSVLVYQVKRQREKDERDKSDMQALKNGTRSILRNELVQMHREHVEGNGFCSLAAKEYATRTYEAYHELDGNGTGTSLYEEIMSLPIRDR